MGDERRGGGEQPSAWEAIKARVRSRPQKGRGDNRGARGDKGRIFGNKVEKRESGQWGRR